MDENAGRSNSCFVVYIRLVAEQVRGPAGRRILWLAFAAGFFFTRVRMDLLRGLRRVLRPERFLRRFLSLVHSFWIILHWRTKSCLCVEATGRWLLNLRSFVMAFCRARGIII